MTVSRDMWEALKSWLQEYPLNNPGQLLDASDVLDHMEHIEDTF